MDNAQINTGEKRITINGDPSRVVVFNPTDTLFAEKFYILMDELQRTLRDYQERANILESNKKKDENGLPVNLLDQIKLQRELSDYFREKIDVTFGEGTSQTAFGETRNLDVCKQFFNGILPFFQTARAEKIAQYTSVTSAKKTKHKK